MKLEKMYEKNKGITLVALVITIVILLILTGISIAQLTGNGLFKNAKLAKGKYENAQDLENSILDDYDNKINSITGTSREENSTLWKLYTTVNGTTEVDISNLNFE